MTGPLLTATYSSLTERFKIDNTNHKLEEITCVRNPQFVANSQQGSCGGNYKLVKIGYNVAGRGFKTIYEICYDYNEMIAKYVKHTLRPGVLDKSKVSDRQTNFEDMASFGPYQFSSFYRNSDRLTLNRNSITRGHLAAQADFFYGVEQIATYIFPNAAPQWSRFNSGNWEELERLLRSNLRQKTLDCYTGVIGVMPYNNKKTGYIREALYLDDAAKKIPVPILYFRVVHDPRTEKGIVFVGVNNVFQKPLPEDYVVCNPVTDKVKGIVLNRDRMDNLNLGYVYACDFNEFHQRYPYLPSLSVKSLLFGEVETA